MGNDKLNFDFQKLKKNYKIVYAQLVEKQDECDGLNQKIIQFNNYTEKIK